MAQKELKKGIFEKLCTVCFRLVYTPISKELKSLFLRNYSKYDNMPYIIEKLYKLVTKNAKKTSNFSTFVRFLSETFSKHSSLNFMKNEYKMGGRGSCLIPTTPIFQTLLFRKWPLKPNKSWKLKHFFLHFGNHFIGIFNGIFHVGDCEWLLRNKRILIGGM